MLKIFQRLKIKYKAKKIYRILCRDAINENPYYIDGRTLVNLSRKTKSSYTFTGHILKNMVSCGILDSKIGNEGAKVYKVKEVPEKISTEKVQFIFKMRCNAHIRKFEFNNYKP
ncbi:hypothetical protein AB733_11690 [Photobacterium swingsii]|uniref:Uncharacterized protein n=1 Tax=Photobacterium swingsii TaxID=680026 RepID=A0A0J8VCS9_9GAMM|nr:hypothetical protein [Photobacterium swingsii]KMV30340.1 hypothetical protein AB733_11690 [Photobacterium swingsii]PSW24496.1 hypothetical protein C9I94_10695 [Photobacterium swingsii]